MDNILLVAINAKYIHSNLAVYNLKECAKEFRQYITIDEYTINEYTDVILREIVKKHPKFIAVSCYIWNIEYVEEILEDFHKICPNVPIWLGGPEVSYESEAFLEEHPYVTGIMCGEGEQTFYELLKGYDKPGVVQKTHNKFSYLPDGLFGVPGIVYRAYDGQIIATAKRKCIDMDDIPFVYENIQDFKNKIIYYESSRGCPFSCSYCLSSVDKQLRFRSLNIVKSELRFFIEHDVPQVKFVDRTFNCNRNRARELWKFLIENDRGITNFHFEIGADLLSQEDFELLKKMRPGLIQLEIGVQSTNSSTLAEINRVMDLDKLSNAVKHIRENNNVHQHLDLIAGLPYEDFDTFRKSFDDVFKMKPNQLQLGFLKVLKGAYMHEMAEKYELKYMSGAPYEVLSTKWITFEEIIRLKGIEEMVEVYYNSGQYSHFLDVIMQNYKNSIDFFDELAYFYEENEYVRRSHSRIARYEILREFVKKYFPDQLEVLSEWLVFDLYARENLKSRPSFANDLAEYKNKIFDFYKSEEECPKYLAGYKGYNFKQLARMTHIEIFSHIDGKRSGYLFIYNKKNPINMEAEVIKIL